MYLYAILTKLKLSLFVLTVKQGYYRCEIYTGIDMCFKFQELFIYSDLNVLDVWSIWLCKIVWVVLLTRLVYKLLWRKFEWTSFSTIRCLYFSFKKHPSERFKVYLKLASFFSVPLYISKCITRTQKMILNLIRSRVIKSTLDS